MAILLETKGLTLLDLKQKNELLTDINIKIETGEFVLLTGINGSGKSTLLKSIFNFMLEPDKYAELRNGEVIFDGKINNRNLNTQIIYISQEDFPGKPLSTVKNALLEAIPEHIKNKKAYLTDWLEKYKALTEEDKNGTNNKKSSKKLKPLLDKRICTLSGGQKKWVSILEGLLSCDINTYKMAFLDEPINNLDSKHIIQLSDLLLRIKKFNPSFSYLIISHCHAFPKIAITKAYKIENKIIKIIDYEDHSCFGKYDSNGFYQTNMSE